MTDFVVLFVVAHFENFPLSILLGSDDCRARSRAVSSHAIALNFFSLSGSYRPPGERANRLHQSTIMKFLDHHQHYLKCVNPISRWQDRDQQPHFETIDAIATTIG
jgi:hypothetical protein